MNREPTPEMRIAGGIAWVKAKDTAETYVDCADACWKAMYDLASVAVVPGTREAHETFTIKTAVSALLAARELIEANRLSASLEDWFPSLAKLRALFSAPVPPADGALARLIALSPPGSFHTTPNWREREKLMDQLRALSLPVQSSAPVGALQLAVGRLLEYSATWDDHTDTSKPSLSADINLVCKAALSSAPKAAVREPIYTQTSLP